MILRVACNRHSFGIDTGLIEQHHRHRHGTGRRQIPIGGEGRVVNRYIVGMAFYPHIEAVLHQHFRNPLDLISRSRHELRLTAVEESKFMKADHETFRGHAQDDLLALDLFAQRLMEFSLQLDHVNAGVSGDVLGFASPVLVGPMMRELSAALSLLENAPIS